ncbi:MAG: sigma-70 family RNA polymerase sigma factor [bacterium]|nr:sigma-70 family RNA polymerase sigma factor [bacterium]
MKNPSEHEGEKAFLAAYDAYGDTIFRFLCMKIADRETARDLTQETFTRAWDYCREGGVIREWKPFLYRTAYNLVVDTYRKKKAVSLDALIEDDGFAVTDDSVGEKSTVARAEMSRVRIAIDALDETYRDIILMRYTEDLPPKEIARITGLSENVVSVRIHRGVEKLRILLGPNTKNI